MHGPSLPTQIIGYLTKSFGSRLTIHPTAILQKIGEVAGVLELYDRLADELIRLSADDYAALIAAIGTVRYRIDQFRLTNHPDCVNTVGSALSTAWRIMETLKDEVPSTSHDLSFISDPVLQEMIGLDISAVSTGLQSGEWKGATILAGSCCEALLLYGIQTRETNARAQ